MTTRTCTKCGEDKPLTADHFPPSRNGFHKYCRACKCRQETRWRRLGGTEGLYDNEPSAAEITKHESAAQERVDAAWERLRENREAAGR